VSQRARFLASEGDAYFARNRGKSSPARIEQDPVLRALEKLDLRPARVLEVGAGDGWRLAALRESASPPRCVGVDPSGDALAEGARRAPRVEFARATAERLPFRERCFDLVILSFCLYLVDRDDLFSVAAEVDRVLASSGHVAVYDFYPEQPHRRRYSHAPDTFSYKMNYSAMFLWNPAYRCVLEEIFAYPGSGPARADDRVAISVLQRDAASAWPERV
jgi:ubiquinone/menaquinone biosynthesis C-methylase UbiE